MIIKRKRGLHYSKPKRWKRILMWTILSVFAVIITLAAAGFFFVYHTLGKMSSNNVAVVQGARKELDASSDQYENILVMGEDDSSKQGNSDTMMLVRIDQHRGFVSILSIPRDLLVEIPGHGKDKINAAYPIGGAPLAIKTVKLLTGEPINHFVTVNFTGFEKAVDALGGVYIDVDQRYYNDNSDAAWGQTYEPINLQPGYQKLNGHDALEYARYRHTDSDFVRIARQQAFLTDAKSQLINWGDIIKIPELANIFGSNTTSDIGPDEALSLIKFAISVKKERIFQQQFPIQEQSGSTYLLVDENEEPTALKNFESPDLKPPQPALPGAPPAPPSLSPSTLSTPVEILNGGAAAGSAAKAASQLGQKGMKSVSVGGDAINSYSDNQIYYQNGSKPAADDLAQLFNPAEEVPMPDGLSSAQVLIVVGKSYAGSLTQPQPQQPVQLQFEDYPQPTPRWQEEAQGSSFKIERPSSFPVDFKYEDFRYYQIDTDGGPKPALKVVCEDQYGNPWGIMETTFTDAPLMDEPSVQKKINGKNYMFFYNGTKLKDLAWKDGGVLYWISNSLMGTLDENTMVQLAVSFKPV